MKSIFNQWVIWLVYRSLELCTGGRINELQLDNRISYCYELLTIQTEVMLFMQLNSWANFTTFSSSEVVNYGVFEEIFTHRIIFVRAELFCCEVKIIYFMYKVAMFSHLSVLSFIFLLHSALSHSFQQKLSLFDLFWI